MQFALTALVPTAGGTRTPVTGSQIELVVSCACEVSQYAPRPVARSKLLCVSRLPRIAVACHFAFVDRTASELMFDGRLLMP